jgi:hypothetical protein
MGRGKRRRIELTDDWELLLPPFSWPEQRNYEELGPVTLFGASVAERARETGTPERTLYRRVERFERDGMMGLFATDPAAARARRRGLEPSIRRMIVELKAEHPRLNDNEISNIVYVRTGSRLGKHTPGRVLSEEVGVPELCFSHGWQEYPARVSHPIRGRCLHAESKQPEEESWPAVPGSRRQS